MNENMNDLISIERNGESFNRLKMRIALRNKSAREHLCVLQPNHQGF